MPSSVFDLKVRRIEKNMSFCYKKKTGKDKKKYFSIKPLFIIRYVKKQDKSLFNKINRKITELPIRELHKLYKNIQNHLGIKNPPARLGSSRFNVKRSQHSVVAKSTDKRNKSFDFRKSRKSFKERKNEK